MENVSNPANYDSPVAVLPDIYWVGFYDSQADLHCNAYVLIDNNDVILVDPGSIPYFSIVMRKVLELVDLDRISLIIVSYQDPDVAGNVAIVEDTLLAGTTL